MDGEALQRHQDSYLDDIRVKTYLSIQPFVFPRRRIAMRLALVYLVQLPTATVLAFKASPLKLHQRLLGAIWRATRNIDILRLEGAGALQKGLQLAALELVLEVGVAANVLLGDPDVGDSALARDLLQGVLEG